MSVVRRIYVYMGMYVFLYMFWVIYFLARKFGPGEPREDPERGHWGLINIF